MSLLAFRDAVETVARTALLGPLSVAPSGRMLSDYDLAPVGFGNGEKGFQVRVWQVQNDGAFDGNQVYEIAGVEVQVYRKLMAEEDERLYTQGGEMLLDQGRLLTHATWTAIGFDFNDGEVPEISGVPTRTDQVIDYEVTFQMRLNPS